MNKPSVVAALLAEFHHELATLERVTQMAVDEATNAESRPENKYDTRSLESSYLAAGQGERVLSLRRLVSFFETIDPTYVSDRLGIGSLACLEENSSCSWFFLAPDGGGRKVVVDGETIAVITPTSPIGALLLGAQVGDTITHRNRNYDIAQLL